MTIELTATADTEPEPMPELAELEHVPEEHPHADEEASADGNATDAASPDGEEDEQDSFDIVDEQEPGPEADDAELSIDDLPVDDLPVDDLPVMDPEDQGAVAQAPAGVVPDLFNGLRAEAKSRSLRTLAQGAVVAVLAQVVLVLYPLAQNLQAGIPFHVDWRAEGLIIAAAAVNALLAYVQKAMGR